jgi:hypothetical protein
MLVALEEWLISFLCWRLYESFDNERENRKRGLVKNLVRFFCS